MKTKGWIPGEPSLEEKKTIWKRMVGDTITPDLGFSAKYIEEAEWTHKMIWANLKGLMKEKSHDKGSSDKVDSELKAFKETNKWMR